MNTFYKQKFRTIFFILRKERLISAILCGNRRYRQPGLGCSRHRIPGGQGQGTTLGRYRLLGATREQQSHRRKSKDEVNPPEASSHSEPSQGP